MQKLYNGLMGALKDGQEIAVYSAQGTDKFKNEVIFIAKLHHQNLVKLLGCCIQAEEKMLIGGHCLITSILLINGIARGLLYHHQDSRLRIIHRDLKPSNILLDIDMNTKISDFDMARSFRGNETGSMTTRVVGT
ncbi:hypothetical protein EJD97_000478 [Solanum chilense]|uniref:non-specific serine/threonine protein kinase n=1 Tax=Solanum chilense TaxID=4083 RepID=A0A6N2AS40_SOLCI|nr:hypothetical protein EJD97_000478 [Solanum chilense]